MRMAGGVAVAVGDAAGRPGLRQAGGDLVLLGKTGPLAGESSVGRTTLRLRGIGSARTRDTAVAAVASSGSPGTVRSIMAIEVAEADHVDLMGLLESFRPWLGPIAAHLFDRT